MNSLGLSKNENYIVWNLIFSSVFTLLIYLFFAIYWKIHMDINLHEEGIGILITVLWFLITFTSIQMIKPKGFTNESQ